MQNYQCARCGKSFRNYKSDKSKYCSWDCKKLASRINHTHICCNCSQEFITKRKNSKYCSQSCAGKINVTLIKNHMGNTNSGKKHWNWQGGGTINTQGYKEIPLGKTNKKILEHRLVMAKCLDRELSKHEHVHHINGDKTDNRIENLVILTPSEHQKLHLARRWHGLTTLV